MELFEAKSVLSNNSKFRWVKSSERWPDGILSSACCLLFHFKTKQGQRQVTSFSLRLKSTREMRFWNSL